MSFSVSHLKDVYARIYCDIPWPRPLPAPEEVNVRWNARFRRTSGACRPNAKIIEVNIIYRDPRLRRELDYLIIHEAAHFIWRGHPRSFKQFLRSVEVPEAYVLGRGEASSIYRLVHGDSAQLSLFA